MRLTLDWDSISYLRMRWRIWKLQSLFTHHPIEVYRSKKGYHVIVHNMTTSLNESYLLRLYFHDDPWRITIDKRKRKSPTQVLWTEKNGFRPYLMFQTEA